MKKWTALLITTLVLVACGTEFSGQLKVVDPNLPGIVNGHTLAFPTGTYKATLSIKSKSKAVLTLKGASASYDLVFKIPSNVTLPSENGPINLTSQQSGQPFDLVGNLATHSSQTAVQNGQVSCTRQEPETVCWGGPHPGCTTHWVNYPGWQQVQYYDVVTEQSLTAELRQTGTAHVSGNLAGSNSDSDRHYISQGPCF